MKGTYRYAIVFHDGTIHIFCTHIGQARLQLKASKETYDEYGPKIARVQFIQGQYYVMDNGEVIR